MMPRFLYASLGFRSFYKNGIGTQSSGSTSVKPKVKQQSKHGFGFVMYAYVLIILLTTQVLAQENSDDSLFGDDNQSQDATDDLFGDSIFSEVDENPNANPADDLLTSDKVILGGNFKVATQISLESDDRKWALSTGLSDLSTTLFLDARPNRDFRAFIKGKLSYKTTDGLGLDLREAFADFAVDNRVFIRAGKQTVNWGVGYFFSPANLINLERVDPENPGLELSGPVALKAQLPLGKNNLTGYLMMKDMSKDNKLSFAARYEFLLRGFEISSGAIIEDNGHWAVMATATGSVSDVTLFAEAVLEANSPKVFVIKDGNSATGLSTSNSESLFFSATLGARYSYTTDDELYTIAGSAQYFFNGKGYADSSIFTDNPAAIAALIGSKALSISDLQTRGQHYLAVNLSSPNIGKTKLNPSALWLSSLSDGSGFVSANLSYSGMDYFTPSFSYRYSYGSEGAEYSPDGTKHSLSLGFTVSGSF